jgi:hypothetical protein
LTRFSFIVALLVVLVIGLQMAACLASGDCLSSSAGFDVASPASPSDCDGCGCCHLHLGFELMPPSPPWALTEFLQPPGPARAAMQAPQIPFRPPRA